MTISVKTYSNGEVLTGIDLNAHLDIMVDEINRLAGLHIANQKPRNLIINGNFSVWQRAITQTSSGYGSDDRWLNSNTGSTKVHTQQTFTLGQTDVTDNPEFYSRTVVTSVANAANFVNKSHRIEGVEKTSGQTVTFTIWAKADAAKNIAVEMIQNFGTGGSPSAAVTAIGVATKAITTGWALQTVTVAVPSISGKTLGTAGDDYFEIVLWMDAGANFDARTNTLGQQSGTFEFANAQHEIAATASDFEYVNEHDQLARCHRYYQTYSDLRIVLAHNTTVLRNGGFIYPVKVRGTPTVTTTTTAMNENAVNITGTLVSTGPFSITDSGYEIEVNNSNTANQGGACFIAFDTTIDAEL